MAKAARATISDVAKAAKTGKTSISRYLNGEKHLLSDDLLGRIEKAIAELDYRPSLMARGLKHVPHPADRPDHRRYHQPLLRQRAQRH